MAVNGQNKNTIGPVTQSKVRGKALKSALYKALDKLPELPQQSAPKKKK